MKSFRIGAEWSPGSVVVRRAAPRPGAEVVELDTTREEELRALSFALRHHGAPFPRFAFALRSVFPVSTGQQYYDPLDEGSGVQRFFCSQLVCILLQAAAGDGSSDGWRAAAWSQMATRHTPNTIFALLADAGVHSGAMRSGSATA